MTKSSLAILALLKNNTLIHHGEHGEEKEITEKRGKRE
jgi:hypothetical protein